MYKDNVSNTSFYIKNFDENEIPWFFDIITESSRVRNNLHNFLMGKGVETRFSYPALSKQKFLKEVAKNNLNVSETIHDKVLWLPSSLGLKNDEIKEIVSKLNSFKA